MRFGLPVLAMACLLGAAAGAEPAAPRVVAAPDAVTLELSDGRRVRLDGLLPPAPDDDGEGVAADRAAAAAHAATLAAIVGHEVGLEPLLAEADRWGLLPADVRRAGDGAWLQGLLLAGGHARVEACPRGDAARIVRLRRAEAAARAAGAGLWSISDYRPRRADWSMRPEGFHLVEGVAVDSGGGRRMRYLNFAKDWRKDFTLRAERRLDRRLAADGLDFEALVGRRVRARGWLIYRNGPMIHIACPQQIEAIDP